MLINSEGFWKVYVCRFCGGLITAAAKGSDTAITEMYPKHEDIDDAVPAFAREYLKQAIESMHAPAGAIMLCASSVDAMLKAKELRSGSLYERIEQAARDHLITEEMAKWAHEVRLDANAQRHSDDDFPIIDQAAAKRCIEFVKALAEFLFVLPSRVQRGLENASSEPAESTDEPA